MPLRFLLDENLRGGKLWKAIQRHNSLGVDPLVAVRVGDPPDLSLGTRDPEILLWAERESRILLSLDKTTLPSFLAHHLAAGHHAPGIFIIRPGSTIPVIVAFLVLTAYQSDPIDWQDRIERIP